MLVLYHPFFVMFMIAYWQAIMGKPGYIPKKVCFFSFTAGSTKLQNQPLMRSKEPSNKYYYAVFNSFKSKFCESNIMAPVKI